MFWNSLARRKENPQVTGAKVVTKKNSQGHVTPRGGHDPEHETNEIKLPHKLRRLPHGYWPREK